MAEKPRLIGIDVIGAVYVLAAILIMMLHGSSTGSTRVVFNILVPMAVATAVVAIHCYIGLRRNRSLGCHINEVV